LDKPKSAKGKLPAVLLVHGFKGDSAQRHISSISRAIVKHGIICLSPDLTKDPGKSYLDFSNMTYGQELSDLEDVYKELSSKLDQVDNKRIGIAGHSLGGMLAVEIASKFPEIKSLVTLSAVYSFDFIAERIFSKPFEQAKNDFDKKGWTEVWSKSLAKELKIKRKFYEDIFGRTADKFISSIDCPVLIVSSGADESVDQFHGNNYLKNIVSNNKKLEIIEGSDHNYTNDKWLKQVCDLTSGWFSKTL